MARSRNRLGLAPAVLLAFALIASGCGGDDDDDDAADTGIESLQAGESGGEAETEGSDGGDVPLGALEFGTEYTMTVDPAAAPNTLSIPPGSVTTVTLEAAAANSSQAGLVSADGSFSIFADPGGTAELDSPIITAAEEGLELTISGQGVPTDRFTFTIDNEPQPDDPDGATLRRSSPMRWPSRARSSASWAAQTRWTTTPSTPRVATW